MLGCQSTFKHIDDIWYQSSVFSVINETDVAAKINIVGIQASRELDNDDSNKRSVHVYSNLFIILELTINIMLDNKEHIHV